MLEPVSLDSPPVPLIQPLSGKLCTGARITINGNCRHGQNRFSVNFNCGDDIAFHFNPRFEGDHYVVRNSKVYGAWQAEERSGPFPFQHGSPFSLVIEVGDHGYNVMVNGQFFTNFPHRLPVQSVDLIEVDGGVELFRVEIAPPPPPTFYGGMPAHNYPTYPGGMYPQVPPIAPSAQPYPYPPPAGFVGGPPPVSRQPQVFYSPPVPFYQTLPNGLQPNSAITVGGVLQGGDGFKIELMCGADVALHFNPRFHWSTVVRNCQQSGEWHGEEKEDGRFPFAYGLPFNVQIQVAPDGYNISINGEFYCHYRHRMPPQAVNELRIDSWCHTSPGALELTTVNIH